MAGRKLEEYIDRDKMLDDLCKCISIESVKSEALPGMPNGKGVSDALNFILDKGKQLGFESRKVGDYVGYIEYGTGSEMIGVLSHIDVVPAGDGWDTDPFKGQLSEGKIVGRGALDDKGPLLASLYALKAIKESGTDLKRRIRLIIGTDEESGSHDMEFYRKHEELPDMAFTPDAHFPVIHSEKGMATIKMETECSEGDSRKLKLVRAGLAVNQVPDKAEIQVDLGEKTVAVASGRGKAAHGSTPEMGINAIDDLIKKITESADYARYPESLRTFAEFYNKYLYDDTRGKKLGVEYTDSQLGDSTFNVGILYKEGDSLGILVDYRYPANMNPEFSFRKIEQLCKREGIEFSLVRKKKGLYFPTEHRLVKALTEVYREETGDNTAPGSMGGGTYAKSLPNMVAFGPLFPGREDTMHQANEYISVEDIHKCCIIYAKAMIKLANL